MVFQHSRYWLQKVKKFFSLHLKVTIRTQSDVMPRKWLVCHFVLLLSGLSATEKDNAPEDPFPRTSFRVLLLPLGFPSHVNEQVVVGKELISRGHQVYFALSDAAPKVKYSKTGLQLVSFHTTEQHTSLLSPHLEEMIGKEVFTGTWNIFSTSEQEIFEILHAECKDMMADQSFLRNLRDLDLDLVIVDGLFLEPCTYILPHFLKIPYATLTGGLNHWFARIPLLPSVSPSSLLQITHDMSFLQRAANLLVFVLMSSGTLLKSGDTELLKMYCPEVTSWSELIMMSEFFLLTMDHHLEWPAPTMPNTRMIPGITLGPSKPLSPEIQIQADAAKQGIIVFSLGSFGGYMPWNLTAKFLEAFSQLEQTIFMRLASNLEGRGSQIPSNVHVMNWIPQNTLLAHPNTKLFITHCGNNGQYESLYHGVPMLGIPLFAEQPHNAFRMQKHGFGLTLDLISFSSSQLRNTILELMHNASYMTSVKKRSAILRDRPMLPKEEAAYWIEHVMKHGGEHLRSAGVKLSLIQFFMLDVLLAFVVTLLILAYVIYRIIKCTFTRCQKVHANEIASKSKQKIM